MFLFIILAVFSKGCLAWMVHIAILLSVWFACCQVFVSGKLIVIHACYIHWCSIVEVVVGMLCVPSLLLGCVHIVLIRIWYSLFLDERGIYHYLLELTKCKRFVNVFVLVNFV